MTNSSLWAAYGDAVGFIAELTDRSGLAHRTSGKELEGLIPWQRRIGGRQGTTVQLPAGAISDDTQLRLATARSIRPSGVFDLETFSKIELTVWPTYALGAGRGSLAAAANLRKRSASWSTNFFSAGNAEYFNGGGNGAAMRVQPHVWAAPVDAKSQSWLPAVLANAVCTHGHPRGFVGAAFHAACLDHALRTASVPGPDEWLELAEGLIAIPDVAARDSDLSDIWLGQWEQRSKRTLAEAVTETIGELKKEIKLCANGSSKSSPRGRYAEAIEAVEAFRPDQRGSATKTVILAALAAHLFADDPRGAVLAPATTLGTDTDTIATMSGAIVGVTARDAPPEPLADAAYIELEATRMAALAIGARPPRFPYPDFVSWTPPKTASDAVGVVGDALHVAGLGPIDPLDDDVYDGKGRAAGRWRWSRTWFGQLLLAKARQRPNGLPDSQRVEPGAEYVKSDLASMEQAARSRPAPDRGGAEVVPLPTEPRSLHEVTDEVIRAGLTDAAIGAGFREVTHGRRAVEDAALYAAIIAKALATREDRRRKR